MVRTHDAIDHIEREIAEKLNMTATCHMDPVEVENPVRVRMQRLVGAKIEEFPEIQGFHDLRVAPGDLRTRIIFDLVMKPGASFSEDEITEAMNRMVKEEDPAFEVVINFERTFL